MPSAHVLPPLFAFERKVQPCDHLRRFSIVVGPGHRRGHVLSRSEHSVIVLCHPRPNPVLWFVFPLSPSLSSSFSKETREVFRLEARSRLNLGLAAKVGQRSGVRHRHGRVVSNVVNKGHRSDLARCLSENCGLFAFGYSRTIQYNTEVQSDNARRSCFVQRPTCSRPEPLDRMHPTSNSPLCSLHASSPSGHLNLTRSRGTIHPDSGARHVAVVPRVGLRTLDFVLAVLGTRERAECQIHFEVNFLGRSIELHMLGV